MNRKRIAVIGGRGFIGSAVISAVQATGAQVSSFSHDALPEGEAFDATIYASGIAFGAQGRAAEAYDLHVAAVDRLFETIEPGRFFYVSSTRVYDGASATREDVILGEVAEGGDVYQATKIAGEKRSLARSENTIVLRLSNVYGESYGSGLFLSDILRQAAQQGRVHVRSSRASEKDYVSVEDVARAVVHLIDVPTPERLYNIARGTNTTHGELFHVLEELGIPVEIAPGSPDTVAPPITVDRLRGGIPWQPSDVLADLPGLFERFRRHFSERSA